MVTYKDIPTEYDRISELNRRLRAKHKFFIKKKNHDKKKR
nr:MAG TPA: hypothetical protein [Caudoviricetes sp.]